MKKTLLLIVAMVLVSLTTLSAQGIRLGVKAGINANPSSISFKNTEENLKEGLSNPVGYHFGAFARVDLPLSLYLQPELVFESNTNQITDYAKQRVTQFDIPVLVGFKIAMIRLNAGPVFNFKISDKMIVEQGYSDITSELINKGVGYQAGIGIDILRKLTLDVKYQSAFSKMDNNFTIKDAASSTLSTILNGEIKQNVVMFSVGYMF